MAGVGRRVVPLFRITVAEALQLWSSILQHDDVELPAKRVRSPISWHDNAFNVWDGKETFISVGLTVSRLHVLMEKEFGEHALRLVQCPTPGLEATRVRDVLVQHKATSWLR
jgi:hypothetical protein